MQLHCDWLRRPSSQRVCTMLEDAGFQALFVGGCVRNALIGAPVSDLDVSTDARPERVMALAKVAGLRAIPTGIEHGTVTVVDDGEPYEITTFRRDVETDGRRAVVAFSDHVEEDARRRDFTMNALYAQRDGTVLDPLGGLDDLKARHVRFIGRASDRIREDYLRSLRFFRFHAWYGDQSQGLDPDALAAIATEVDGLTGLSRERVGSETLKLLSAPDPAPSMAAMRMTGAMLHVLPGADDTALAPLIHLEALAGKSPDPVRRLAVLGDMTLAETLRLSRIQLARVTTLRDHAVGTMGAAELGYRLGAGPGQDAILIRAALLEQPLNMDDLELAARAAQENFPVSAKDLMPAYSGARLGKALKKLEKDWIASGFKLTQGELLARARHTKG